MTSIGRGRIGGIAAALALLAGGGSAASAQAAAPTGLVAFSSCEELLGYAQANAPRIPRYDPSMPVAPSLPMPTTAPPPASPDMAAGGEALSEEPDFSGTNVQEEGVDEPDTVKTDGRRIFAIAEGRFVELDGRSDSPRVLGGLSLEGEDHQLLLRRGRAIVIAQVHASGPLEPVPATMGPAARASLSPAPRMPSQTLLTELDLGLTGRPRIVRNLRVEGMLRAARMVEGVVRLVVSSTPRGLADESARSEVGDWVPSYRVRNRRTGRNALRPVAACSQISHPQTYDGLGLLTVMTIDLDRGLTPADSDSILADVDTVYGTSDALYVTSTLPSSTESATLVHKFVTGADGQTTHRASGTIPGSLLSQWALSEQEGVLRAASTVSAWSAGAGNTSESFVTTYAERDGRLVELARVGGLGRGERIYAVRFIGDVGYVVTFRQVDPLYTLDLADPRRPRLLGELKIPGYSAYLHPVGEDLLLGVGQDATEQGMRTGAQVSLFDVSNLSAPRRVATAPLSGWASAVEQDHRAFLYWPRTRFAFVPTDGSSRDGTAAGDGGVGFRITRADGLKRVGAVRHPDGRQYGGGVDRSVVMGRRLLTLFDDGMLSSDLATLGDPRWVAFG
ncbi:beta-propeller domain-containing protein [Conexibacter stalactiti]|uniref:Beta-propeller domain-containing protein n=1 Tax=Conexibacter stalactiti TaxID=1940611 RepID=A0ABU4HQ59_9ACTN|nr:beta-propeller domain-containing protein [Conexibacter stalactiti]MDW5595407.1 beta-propeller domain-containing protein [Conexibacter stalactiti]MEC5036049.1 beta-propeller domain-containing protein [Conexibacter stalactiti]